MATSTTNLYQQPQTADAAKPRSTYYRVVDGQLVPVEGVLGNPSAEAQRELRIGYAQLDSDGTARLLRVKTAYACVLDLLNEVSAHVPKGQKGDLDEARRLLLSSSMWAVRSIT